VNPAVVHIVTEAGLHFTGRDGDTGQRMEIAELPKAVHPFYFGVQFHPEYVLYSVLLFFFLPSLLGCDVSISHLSIYCSLLAFSDTTWHESNHHPPLNQSSIDTILTFL
jgi:hypothetical protein